MEKTVHFPQVDTVGKASCLVHINYEPSRLQQNCSAGPARTQPSQASSTRVKVRTLAPVNMRSAAVWAEAVDTIMLASSKRGSKPDFGRLIVDFQGVNGPS